MRLTKVILRNFRCHTDLTEIEVGRLTAIIGRNDSGKSSVLEALQFFFDDKPPDCDDGSIHGNKAECCIACEFDNLPDDLVIDANVQTTLQNEYLLNERGRLEIHKTYNCNLKTPKLAHIRARAIHPAAPQYDDLLSLKKQQLATRAQELGVNTTDVNLNVNSVVRRAIWEHCPDLQLTPKYVPLDDEGSRPVWEQLSKLMPLYQLFRSDRASTDQDAEAQDPMKAAVKEALKTRQAELDAISQYVEQEVRTIAERTVAKIKEMNQSLANELHPKFVAPKWDSIFKMSLTGDEDIPVNKRGSGVRRLILLNFFRAQAERLVEEKQACGVIYAVEEPETCQHPDNQKLLMRAFEELSQNHGCQVLLTTHNPSLARLLPIDSLRYIEFTDAGNRIIHQGEAAAPQAAKALGVLPDNGVRLFVGVEGINDVLFLHRMSKMLYDAGEPVPHLEELDKSGVIVFVPLGGGNLIHWVGRLANLNRPEFHVYDRDQAPPGPAKYQAAMDLVNAQQGCFACCTSKRELENYLHADAIHDAKGVIIGVTDFADVPVLAAQAIHAASGSAHQWDQLDEEKRSRKESAAKHWLNTEAAARMTPARLTAIDPAGDVRGWLTRIAQMMQ